MKKKTDSKAALTVVDLKNANPVLEAKLSQSDLVSIVVNEQLEIYETLKAELQEKANIAKEKVQEILKDIIMLKIPKALSTYGEIDKEKLSNQCLQGNLSDTILDIIEPATNKSHGYPPQFSFSIVNITKKSALTVQNSASVTLTFDDKFKNVFKKELTTLAAAKKVKKEINTELVEVLNKIANMSRTESKIRAEIAKRLLNATTEGQGLSNQLETLRKNIFENNSTKQLN